MLRRAQWRTAYITMLPAFDSQFKIRLSLCRLNGFNGDERGKHWKFTGDTKKKSIDSLMTRTLMRESLNLMCQVDTVNNKQLIDDLLYNKNRNFNKLQNGVCKLINFVC